MTDSDVKDMIVRAWENARESTQDAGNGDEKDVHTDRSKAWVCALAKELEHRCKKDGEDIRVFWKGMEEGDKDFEGRKELLFDVSVCQVKSTVSFHDRQTPRHFVDNCLWLVESEFDSASMAIIVDLSKLVMGSSKMKLFVAGMPLWNSWKGKSANDLEKLVKDREKEILKMCKEAANRCGEHFYFCFIPHPKVWHKPCIEEYEPSIWVLKKDRWREL